jgi:hypothetical protein
MSQDDLSLLKWTLSDPLVRFEQTLSLAFPRGTDVRGNLDATLRADTLTRYQSYEIALKNGFLDVDEVREYEHRPPLPEKQPEVPDAFSQEFPPKEITP